MGASVEILVCGTPNLKLDDASVPFNVVTSSPPRSHRGSSALWQSEFERDGGTLVHIGDPDMDPHRACSGLMKFLRISSGSAIGFAKSTEQNSLS